MLLLHRLGSIFRINARRPQKQQLLYPAVIGRVHDVALNKQVVADKVSRGCIVGQYTSHLGRSQKDVLRTLHGKEASNRRLVSQVQLRMGANNKAEISLSLQLA